MTRLGVGIVVVIVVALLILGGVSSLEHREEWVEDCMRDTGRDFYECDALYGRAYPRRAG